MHDAGLPAGAADTLPGPEADENMTRRRFTKVAMGAVGLCYATALGYPIYRYLATPSRRAAEVAAVSEVSFAEAELPPSGSVLMFRFGARPAMLIHHADGSYVCFDAVCTHLGCTVQYQPEEGRIFCACHGGVYDPRTGGNVAGPPPKPLKPFTVEIANGKVTVTRA
jgi:cytochrome b6-f complex iron-sulfur subunit